MSAAVEPVDAGAFDLGQGRDAALCLHGLTGTPYEVRPLGAALAAHGVRALGPLLPGHGGAPEALAAVDHREWLDAVRTAHQRLCREHVRVSVVGLSLGGLLALALAAERTLDALVAIATPLRLRSRWVGLLPLARRLRAHVPKRRGSDIRDAAARARHPSMGVMPLAGAYELVRLQRRVRAVLDRVRAPILVAHGCLDATAHPDDARWIAGHVASGERELLWLANSGHVVPVDHDGPELAEAVVRFCTRPRQALR